MLLTRVRVRDYRSIHDTGDIDIESEKTLLVGVNEAGKTAILKALQQVNPPVGTTKLAALYDYPRSRYAEIQRGSVKPADVHVTEAEFSLSDSDKAAILAASPQSTDVETFVVYRNLNNTINWNFGPARLWAKMPEIESDLKRLRAHIQKKENSDEAVAALDELTSRRRFSDAVSGQFATDLLACLETAFLLVDENDEKEEQRYERLKNAASLAGNVNEALKKTWQRIPLFVYYSTYFTVRPRINLAALADREAANDLDEEYDFGNLCLLRLLGFSARELSDLALGEPNPATYPGGIKSDEFKSAAQAHQEKLDARQYALNAASVDLTRSIREVWGDDQVQLSLRVDGQYLKVVVVDDLGVEVELDQRSEGFRWLVSFFVVFKSQAQSQLKNAVLLLDEPGLSLHALKQQEFRKTVTRLSADNQVIYTTHSPFMVGSDELDLVRVVETIDKNVGTKVHTRLLVEDPRSIYPLQAALGYELAQSLFGQKRNLVCEGLTDMMFIEALNAAFADGDAGLKHEVALVPASSASKVIYYATVLTSQKLKVAALLDSDTAGESAASQNELVALLTNKRILRTKDYTTNAGGKPEVEDLLRDTLVHIAKDELGWDIYAKANAQPGRRIVEIFRAEITGFSKYKLVRAFIRWMGAHDVSDLTQSEQDGIAGLFKDINKALA